MHTPHKELTTFMASEEAQRLFIISGGQTGVDRAALDVALELRLPCRGWCPLGFEAEDGTIPRKYPMQETTTADPALRTELNIIDSDATLLITHGEPTDGTALTYSVAERYNKPVFEIDFMVELSVDDKNKFYNWLNEKQIKNLNIAGPRESFMPGSVYLRSHAILKTLLTP